MVKAMILYLSLLIEDAQNLAKALKEHIFVVLIAPGCGLDPLAPLRQIIK